MKNKKWIWETFSLAGCVCVEFLLLISLHFYLAKIAIFRLLKLTPIYDPPTQLYVP